MIINSISIENILSHENTFVLLHPGVNAFLGESDVGKSAIFRAVRKVAQNRPAGTDFITWGKKDCSIVLDLEEGKLVEWAHRNNENLYIISEDNGKDDIDEQVFKAFGQKVPDEISQLLNIDDINFQHQLATSFLFQSSPGEVARYLNKIVNLDIIDITQYNINARLKEESGELADAETDIKRLTKELKEFNWLDNAEANLDEIQALENEIEALRSSRSVLHTSVNAIIALEERTFKYEQITTFESEVDNLLKEDSEIQSLIDDYNNLQFYIDEIDRCESKIKKADVLIAFELRVSNLVTLNNEIIELSREYQNLEDLLYAFDECQKDIERYNKEKNKLEAKFHKAIGDVCPLCEQEIRKQNIQTAS